MENMVCLSPLCNRTERWYINWLADFLPMPTASSLTENHLLKSCKRPKNGTATTVTTESSTRTEIATLHDATLDIDLRKGLTHLEDCPRSICSHKLSQTQKASIVMMLTFMTSKKLGSLKKWPIFNSEYHVGDRSVAFFAGSVCNVGFLGKCPPLFAEDSLAQLPTILNYSHSTFNYGVTPSQPASWILAPFSTHTSPPSHCPQRERAAVVLLQAIALGYGQLSPESIYFGRNGQLNLEKKKKNCHEPMLTHPQSCLTYFSTRSDHSFK